MTLRNWLLLALFAISSIGYFPLSEWISTTPIGTTLLLWGQMIYGFPLIAAVLALPGLIVAMFFQRTRRQATFFLPLSVLFIPCCVTGIILGRHARMAGMETCAERAQPLIAAIQQYERDHSVPPRSLDDLVPRYLSEVPTTGMMAYPRFDYHTGATAEERYPDNPWALSIFTPGGGLNFDSMLYFPNQNYPKYGYGGSLQRIGDWAYVHE